MYLLLYVILFGMTISPSSSNILNTKLYEYKRTVTELPSITAATLLSLSGAGPECIIISPVSLSRV